MTPERSALRDGIVQLAAVADAQGDCNIALVLGSLVHAVESGRDLELSRLIVSSLSSPSRSVHAPRGAGLSGSDVGADEAVANARLIASAPDMLAACRTVLDRLDYLRGLWGDEAITRTTCDALAAAFARAKERETAPDAPG